MQTRLRVKDGSYIDSWVRKGAGKLVIFRSCRLGSCTDNVPKITPLRHPSSRFLGVAREEMEQRKEDEQHLGSPSPVVLDCPSP